MNINIICIGKIKESFYRDAVAEYAKRLTRFCKFNILELAESRLEGNDINKVKINEGKSILSKLKGYEEPGLAAYTFSPSTGEAVCYPAPIWQKKLTACKAAE